MFVNIFTRHGEAVARLSFSRFLSLPSQEKGGTGRTRSRRRWTVNRESREAFITHYHQPSFRLTAPLPHR